MTPLASRLRARIEATGPISMAAYMSACLTDPDHGYYTTRKPLGPAGDFVTAPELSQMFGEMIGLWLAQMWMDAGAPQRLALLELGPGRGTLMADVLRAARAVRGFCEAVEVLFLEVSPGLQSEQRKAVPKARHVATLAELPNDLPLFVLANEYFDALPVRQFQRIADGWAERRVGLVEDDLGVVTGPPQPRPGLTERYPLAADGTIVELNEMAEAQIRALAGADTTALIIDYGAWAGTGDTLQAVRAHDTVPVFDAPGQVDLTTHVAFAPLAAAGSPLHPHFTTQGAFLERLGITARAQALAGVRGGEGGRSDHAHIAAHHRRLTHPDEMGTLFKVLALTPSPEIPPGFET